MRSVISHILTPLRLLINQTIWMSCEWQPWSFIIYLTWVLNTLKALLLMILLLHLIQIQWHLNIRLWHSLLSHWIWKLILLACWQTWRCILGWRNDISLRRFSILENTVLMNVWLTWYLISLQNYCVLQNTDNRRWCLILIQKKTTWNFAAILTSGSIRLISNNLILQFLANHLIRRHIIIKIFILVGM